MLLFCLPLSSCLTLTFFSPSPTYISYLKDKKRHLAGIPFVFFIFTYTSLAWISSIRLPLSLATALASMVFPVPGGPKRSTPEIKFRLSIPCWNRSGRCSGRDIRVCKVSMVDLGARTSLKVLCTFPTCIKNKHRDELSRTTTITCMHYVPGSTIRLIRRFSYVLHPRFNISMSTSPSLPKVNAR